MIELLSPALATAEVVDPTSNPWIQFGVLGLFTGILVVVVRALYTQLEKSYNARIEDKQKQYDHMILEKDQTIDRLLNLLQDKAMPSIDRSTQVMEALQHKDNVTLDRLARFLDVMEAPPANHPKSGGR